MHSSSAGKWHRRGSLSTALVRGICLNYACSHAIFWALLWSAHGQNTELCKFNIRWLEHVNHTASEYFYWIWENRERKSIVFLRHMWHGKRTLGHRATGAKCFSVSREFSRPGSGKGACSWFSKTSSDSWVYVSITLLKCQLQT